MRVGIYPLDALTPHTVPLKTLPPPQINYPFQIPYLSPDTLSPEGTWDQRYPTPPPLVDRMTHACENIAFPQLRWRAVKTVARSINAVSITQRT